MFEISSALTALQTGISLAVGAMDAHDDVTAKRAVGELSGRLVEAQMGALRMAEMLAKLRSELDESKAELAAAQKRLDQRANYVLRSVAPGCFAYAYMPLGDDSAPAHYQCQICFDRGESSILSLADNSNFLRCRIEPKHTIRIANNVSTNLLRNTFGHWD